MSILTLVDHLWLIGLGLATWLVIAVVVALVVGGTARRRDDQVSSDTARDDR